MAAFRTYVLLVSLGVLFGQSTAGMSESVCMDDCIAVSVMIMVCTTVSLVSRSFHCVAQSYLRKGTCC